MLFSDYHFKVLIQFKDALSKNDFHRDFNGVLRNGAFIMTDLK